MSCLALRSRNISPLSVCGALTLLATPLALLSAAPAAVHAAPDVCTVQAHNPHSSIHQAVDNGCSQIRVTPGTYHENVVIPAGDTVTISSVAGAGKTIVDGGGVGRAFTLYRAVNVTLTGLTIQNGSANVGGGIYNGDGTLTLNDSVVSGNSAGSEGGGIYNSSGTVTLNNTSVTGNNAGLAGGGIVNVFGTTTLTNSPVSGNSATNYGGGIFNVFGATTLNSSPVSGNSASKGGGIVNFVGTVTYTNSPVTNNTPDNIFSL